MSQFKSGEAGAWAYLSVTCDAPLAEVEAWFGLPGNDRSWSIGTQRKNVKYANYQFTRWSLQSGLPKGAILDEHLRALWPRVVPLWDAFRTRPREWKGYVVCVGHIAGPDTPIALSAGHFKMMAKYDLELDCDLYFEGESDADPLMTWP